MDTEKLKIQIGNNIAACRRKCDMTQAELADKLNYSDKAVSKWERGESVPDVMTLVQVAKLFGITVDALLADDEISIGDPQEVKKAKRRANKGVIQTLSSLLVWFVALTLYVVLSSVGIPKTEVAFVYAIPVNAIVLLVLRSAFGRYNWNHALVSLIVWGSLLSIYVTLLVFVGVNVWKLALLGLLGQAAVTLWFRMFRTPKEIADV